MFQVVYKRRAARTLQRMPAERRRRIRSAIDAVAKDPDAPDPNVKRLQGREGYRLRIGSWRVLYDVDRGRLIVLVIDIGARVTSNGLGQGAARTGRGARVGR